MHWPMLICLNFLITHFFIALFLINMDHKELPKTQSKVVKSKVMRTPAAKEKNRPESIVIRDNPSKD
ncbi:MAG: hypothetical protein ISR65_08630 [Bacteriovoracaceae bacterium]|nr:hypothetical protein [Bacteriovoracaceae bacterium]